MSTVRRYLEEALSGESAKARIFAVFLLVLCATHFGVLLGVRAWVAFFAILGILSPRIMERPLYWVTIAFTLALDLIPNYPSAANHYWLTLYVSIYFLISSLRLEQNQPVAFNVPRALLVVTFGVAGLQKVISSYFASGRLLEFYFIRGDSFDRVFTKVYPEFDRVKYAFWEAHAAVAGSHQLGGVTSAFELPGPGFIALCVVLTVTIIVVELAAFAALAWNRVFEHRAMDVLMLMFLWGTFLFRGEYTFFALLSMLYFLAKPQLGLGWKLAFVASMAVFISLDAGGIDTVF